MSLMQRLTPARLGDILATEPKAVAIFDDNMRVIGVELPAPEGIVYADGSRTKTALFGDRVGQDRYGHWIVTPAPGRDTQSPADSNGWPGDEHAEPGTRGWTA